MWIKDEASKKNAEKVKKSKSKTVAEKPGDKKSVPFLLFKNAHEEFLDDNFLWCFQNGQLASSTNSGILVFMLNVRSVHKL